MFTELKGENSSNFFLKGVKDEEKKRNSAVMKLVQPQHRNGNYFKKKKN